MSSSTYTGSDRWDDVLEIRELMEETDVQKPYACSSIELNGMTPTKSHELI